MDISADDRSEVRNYSARLLPLLHELARVAAQEPIKQVQFVVLLGRLFANSSCQNSDVLKFARGYVPSINLKELLNCCEAFSSANQLPVKAKKRKLLNQETSRVVSLSDFVYAVYSVVKSDPKFFASACDCSVFVPYLASGEPALKWHSARLLQLVLSLTDWQLSRFYGSLDAEERKLIEQCQSIDIVASVREDADRANDPIAAIELFAETTFLSELDIHSVTARRCKEIVEVCGVFLPRFRHSEMDQNIRSKGDKDGCTFKPLDSMKTNGFVVASAISASKPVLIVGPIGCGKSALVEWIAAKVGRTRPPFFAKIQMGEQVDAKTLLGQYQCTDIPSEFVWIAGPLLDAMTNGNWILLEDLDCASMDVLAVLCSVLEKRSVNISGRGQFEAHPDFQLFATLRHASHSANVSLSQSLRNHSSSFIFDKPWIVAHLQNFSDDDLSQCIKTRFPNLSPYTERLISTFRALENNLTSSMSSSGDVRPLSVRDFFKWCNRLSRLPNLEDPSLPYLEAFDCFGAFAIKAERRLEIGHCLAAQLNVTKEKVTYYLRSYKAELKLTESEFFVGRRVLKRAKKETLTNDSIIAFTRPFLRLLEQLSASVAYGEPVLLTGETGGGKTTAVEFLAKCTGHKLHVVNMSHQSESSDLLGGIKPVDFKQLVIPLKTEYLALFGRTFPHDKNVKFFSHLETCFAKARWSDLFFLMSHTVSKAIEKTGGSSEWAEISNKVQHLTRLLKQNTDALAFSFVEGVLLKALKSGEWILLDEINLAPPETLDCLNSFLDASASGSLMVLDKGGMERLSVHPAFRLFGCMNPATDVGKRNLQPGIRSRFTEIYLEELEAEEDLHTLVVSYLNVLALSPAQLNELVAFYRTIRATASTLNSDAFGHAPHFSLRTLCRALSYARLNPFGDIRRSLYEAFCLSFLTELDLKSHSVVQAKIAEHIISKNPAAVKALLAQSTVPPRAGNFKKIEAFWIECGPLPTEIDHRYVLTETVRRNLSDVARAVSCRRYPVLLQGETSVGKTSLISYVARLTGNVCIRINNHEHTDLQEYLGSYVADAAGKLVFVEGPLVQAMRRGHWVILDELNLAPPDVLEALNRLLDDNRELFIPEINEMVKAHPAFMLFATQNPPGLYGGRKMLSRAFRNRFVEFNFNELPFAELELILQHRCLLPASYAKKMVQVMHDLQLYRSMTGVFAGKESYMTLRDLFRWAERYRLKNVGDSSNQYFDWDQYLADQGYFLLGGRIRRSEDAAVIQEVIQKLFKRSIDPTALFSPKSPYLLLDTSKLIEGFEHIVWTANICRLAVLLGQALHFREPVLLVGETGCGKTSLCQIFAKLSGLQLHSVNCHLMTESADFLGRLKPTDSELLEQGVLFEWSDGALVEAMRRGEPLLIDEISLADDSVLERLNSVLEPERTLLLSEKGGSTADDGSALVLRAKEGFGVMATMNPAGDFGKKELSTALRNRLTEIWCDAEYTPADIVAIAEHNLVTGALLQGELADVMGSQESGIGKAIVEFALWLSTNYPNVKRCYLTVRDVLAWVSFINKCVASALPADVAYVNGAFLVLLDSLGNNLSNSADECHSKISTVRRTCAKFLTGQLEKLGYKSQPELLQENPSNPEVRTEGTFGISPFFIPLGGQERCSSLAYSFDAPTCRRNLFRMLRAMQLPKPILLEGSPGVGKSSLVMALAKASGYKFVRINLSEQTDMSDLFGSNLPTVLPNGKEGFAWHDGPLLKAMKDGHWVLLDEMNLASQSVLEGLNACFDHRGEVYIPELTKSFKVNAKLTRFFACQNPFGQISNRNGLPRSFVNRFSVIYMDALETEDELYILRTLHLEIDREILEKMVLCNRRVYEAVCQRKEFALSGGPWEFNLRDLMRWCDLVNQAKADSLSDLLHFFDLLYLSRLRSSEDRQQMLDVFHDCFGHVSTTNCDALIVTPASIFVGDVCLPRLREASDQSGDYATLAVESNLRAFPSMQRSLKKLAQCVRMSWLSILVGPSCSGKTTIVESLAALTGNPLQTIYITSEHDANDLVGSFEQVAADVRIRNVSQKLLASVLAKCQTLLAQNEMRKLQKLLRRVFRLASSQRQDTASIDFLLDFISVFKKFPDLTEQLAEMSASLKQIKESTQYTRFEWTNSSLVQALLNGAWLLVENVNFCSAAVLDRLNALLEPGGTLTVTERGLVDGKLCSYAPAPGFRVLFTMDPKHGEISRAMRNRGVEIFLTQEECWLGDSAVTRSVAQSQFNVSSDLAQELCKSLIAADHIVPTSGYQLLQTCFLVSRFIASGLPEAAALAQAMQCTHRQHFTDESTLVHQSTLAVKLPLFWSPRVADLAFDSVRADLIQFASYHCDLVKRLVESADAGDAAVSRVRSALLLVLLSSPAALLDQRLDVLLRIYGSLLSRSDKSLLGIVVSLQHTVFQRTSTMLRNSCVLGLSPWLALLENLAVDLRWTAGVWQRFSKSFTVVTLEENPILLQLASDWNNSVLSTVSLGLFTGVKAESQSVLKMAKAVRDQEISPADLPSLAFQYFPELFAKLKCAFTSLFEQPGLCLPNRIFEKLLTALSLLRQFLAICTANYDDVARRYGVLIFALQFHWLNKALVRVCIEEFSDVPFLSEITALAEQISANLAYDRSSHKQFCTVIAKLMPVKPFVSKVCLDHSIETERSMAKIDRTCEQLLSSVFGASKRSDDCGDLEEMETLPRLLEETIQTKRELLSVTGAAGIPGSQQKSASSSDFLDATIAVRMWPLTKQSHLCMQLLASRPSAHLTQSHLVELGSFLVENCQEFPTVIQLSLRGSVESDQVDVASAELTTLKWLQALNATSATIDGNAANVSLFLTSHATRSLVALLATSSEGVPLCELSMHQQIIDRARGFVWAQAPSLDLIATRFGPYLDNLFTEWETKLALGIPSDRSVPRWQHAVAIGLRLMDVLGTPGLIDPVMKAEIKQALLISQLAEAESELADLNAEHRFHCGHDLTPANCDDVALARLHPYVRSLALRVGNIKSDLEKLGSRIGYRPAHSQFLSLCAELVNLSQMCQSLKRSLQPALTAPATVSIATLLPQLQSWLRSIEFFQKKLSTDFAAFVDIVSPYQLAISFIQLGANILCDEYVKAQALATEFELNADSTEMVKVTKFVLSSGLFVDSLSFASLADQLLSVVRASFPTFDTFKLFKWFLTHGSYHSSARALLCKSAFAWLAETWREQNTDTVHNYYEYREKSHAGGPPATASPEEREEAELRALFPDFTTDFARNAEPMDTETSSDQAVEKSEDRSSHWRLSHKDLSEFLRLIREKEQGAPADSQGCLWAEGIVVAWFERFGRLMPNIDTCALSDAFLALSTAAKACSRKSTDDRKIDLYEAQSHGSENLAEGLAACDKLSLLRDKAAALLSQFPEHPSLIQICESIKRTLNLPTNSPLMKLAAGLERVLFDCQEWETNFAARHVSLEERLLPLRQLLLRWRKMEISRWGDLLDGAERELANSAWPLCFDLFDVLQSFLEQKLAMAEVVSACRGLLDRSQGGQFLACLQMLQFLGGFLSLETTDEVDPAQGQLTSILHHLHDYYSLHVDQVSAHLKTLRAPLEKELKDFLAIVKFKDLNFWFMKESAQKAHRQLFKLVKKYKEALSEPIAPILAVICPLPSLCTSDAIDFCQMPTSVSPLTPSLGSGPPGLDAEKHSSLANAQMLQTKMVEFVAQLMRLEGESDLKDDLREFSTSAIDVGATIAKVVEYRGTEDEKQKQFRVAMNRRQTALADLLKSLQNEDFSYRKGLQLDTETDVKRWLESEKTVTPIDSHTAEADRLFCLALQYLQSLGVLAQKPNQQLAVGVLQRMRGLGAFSLNAQLDQCLRLNETVKHFANLKAICDVAATIHSDLADSSCASSIREAASIDAFVETAKDVCAKILSHLERSQRLLEAIPGEAALAAYRLNLPSQLTPPIAVVANGDSASLVEAKASLKQLVDDVTALQVDLEKTCKRPSKSACSYIERNTFTRLMRALGDGLLGSDFSGRLSSLLSFTSFPPTEGSLSSEPSFFATHLTEAHKLLNALEIDFVSLKSAVGMFASVESPCDGQQKDACLAVAEKLTKECLLVVQKVYKRRMADAVASEAEPKSTLKSTTELFEVLGLLNVKEISDFAKELLASLGSISTDGELLAFVLGNVTSVTNTYFGLCDCFVKSALNVNLAFGALSLNQLNLYLALVKNGYVNPVPEIAQGDGEKGQSGRFEEGMGLGEGEGLKDVSDEIEDESQVEGTRNERKQKEPGEEQQLPEQDDQHKPIDMDDLSDAELEDVPRDKDDEQNDSDDDDKQSETEEDRDWQKGDVDQSEEEELDPNLWNDKDKDKNAAGEENEPPKLDDKTRGANKKQQNLVAKEHEHEKELAPNGLEVEASESEESGDENDGSALDENEPETAQEEGEMHFENLRLDENDGDDETDSEEGSGQDEKGADRDEENSEGDENNSEMGGEIEEIEDVEEEHNEGESEDLHAEKKADQEKENAKDPSASFSQTGPGQSRTDAKEKRPEDSSRSQNIAPGADAEEGAAQDDDGSLEETPLLSEQPAVPLATNNSQQTAAPSDGAKGVRSAATGGQGKTMRKQIMSDLPEEEQQGGGEEAFDEDTVTKAKQIDDKLKTLADLENTDLSRTQRRSIEDAVKSQPGKKRQKLQANDKVGHIASESSMETDEREEEADGTAIDFALLNTVQKQLQQLKQFLENNAEGNPLNPDLFGSNLRSFDSTRLESATDETAEESRKKDEERPSEQPSESLQRQLRDKMAEAAEEEDKADEEALANTKQLPSTIHTVMSFFERARGMAEQSDQDESGSSKAIGAISVVTEAEGQSQWRQYQNAVQPMVAELSENLRMILEPTLASKFQGDYRTGKRLNMRRLIPYIASNFRRNKIWLRRTKKSKRSYQVMIAIDNSSSMEDNQSKQMALEAVALLGSALQQLEVGQLGVCKFGADVSLLHEFGAPFVDQAGVGIVRQLQFDEKKTNVSKMLHFVTNYFERHSGFSASSAQATELPAKLLLIVSDGRGIFANGIEPVTLAVRNALLHKIFMVYVILDNPKNKSSILDIKMPIFHPGDSMPEMKSYMDFFPFSFYVILRQLAALPAIAGDALRQWFELIANSS